MVGKGSASKASIIARPRFIIERLKLGSAALALPNSLRSATGDKHARFAAFEDQSVEIGLARELNNHRLEFAKNGLTDRVRFTSGLIECDSSDTVG